MRNAQNTGLSGEFTAVRVSAALTGFQPTKETVSQTRAAPRDPASSPFLLPEVRELPRSIAKLGMERIFARGVHLYRQGELATSFYYALAGRIRVFMTGIDGSDRDVAFAGPCTTIGEYGIFDDQPRYTSAVAVEDSRVLVIDHAAIMSAGRADPEIFIELARRLAQKTRLGCMHVMYAGLPARVRVATLFVQLLNAYGTLEANNTARLSKSHRVEDFAHLVGVTRVTMSRELARFVEEGILLKIGREIIISDIAALHAVADTSGLVHQYAND
ncbi:Crp/Fnr family transcriptional regulator [Paraburkholderia aspalathi]|uniref:cAMP-binding domain of CRP or a regulatory subunit of cAMP-dependent protein kinases n=1 Tax=Paraburkholderia aspalathi TaxID=1324617 RepID=A0A1I7ESG7_9BURK|nr:Crp/Fnr family transcriptional regulator [Paraburkholderia aspalathi]SFU26867.1 cAMP-binding domain of CRP or a regulatory subunit of cAMP-dependent protein kinases [Paraburkholderia aspalathi]